MPKFQRARNEDQVEERRANILATAKTLCAENGVMGWSLNELGRRASINKSNLYRYFGSKEEVLMRLMAIELENFVDCIDQSFKRDTFKPENFSKTLAAAYTQRPFLCELLSISASVLETRINVDAIAAIKKDVKVLVFQYAEIVDNCLDWINTEKAFFATCVIALFASSLYPIANPQPALAEVLQRAEFECFNVNYEEMLIEYIETVIAGCKATGKPISSN